MPIRVGAPDTAAGWRPVPDLRVGGLPVASVHLATPGGLVEVWRPDLYWEQAGLSKTVTAPAWANYIDIVALGAGSGGVCGNGGNYADGNGGNAGAFASTCWTMVPGCEVIISIGQGGAGGVGGDTAANGGKPGGATTVTHGDAGYVLTAAGGALRQGQGGAVGGIPGSYAYLPPAGGVLHDSTTLTGGSPGAGKNGAAPWPGGGGGGGGGGILNTFQVGKPGAAGIVWYRFRAY